MVALARQPARGPGRQIADPQIAERLEHHLGPVRRGAGPADHADVERVRRDLDGEADGVLHPAGVGDVEGDVRDRLGADIDALDAAVGPEDDGAVVRRPADRRIDAVDRPGFLQVAVEGRENRRLTAGLDVHHIEDGLVANPADEGDRLAVGRGRRADRAARAGDVGIDLAGFAVQTADDVNLVVDVLGIFKRRPRRRVVAEVDVAAVGREGGLARVLLLGPALGHLHAAAARAVVHPQFARPQRAGRGEMLPRHDELAVGRPFGLVQQAEGLLRHLRRVGAVGVHDPDIVAARPVRGEGDGAPVRRPFRLHVPGHARGDGAGLAAADRHDIDVAQHVEDDGLAVRADVERHPGAAGDVDRDVARRPGRVLHIPFGGLGRSGGRRDDRSRRSLRINGPGNGRRGQRRHRLGRLGPRGTGERQQGDRGQKSALHGVIPGAFSDVSRRFRRARPWCLQMNIVGTGKSSRRADPSPNQASAAISLSGEGRWWVM